MPNNQTNKPRLVFQLLVAAGLVSFAAWSVAQIPPPGIPAGWTVTSDGGCLKPSNQSKLNNEQKQACDSAWSTANNNKYPGNDLCGSIGGTYDRYSQSNKCKKP
jgi:hypothetical protein